MARLRGWMALPLVALGAGCGLGPKHFRDIIDPSAVMRARAVGLGEEQPEAVAIPALLARLEDADPVVRMTANEALRRRTGQDFGFVAWGDLAERRAAVARWQSWWRGRSGTAQAGLARIRRIR